MGYSVLAVFGMGEMWFLPDPLHRPAALMAPN